MKPKEKAVELVDKFLPIVFAESKWDEDAHEDAKQCALICVDEVSKCVFKSTDVQEYWNEVKTEIQNL